MNHTYKIYTYILTLLITLNVYNIKAQTYQDSIKNLKIVIVVGKVDMTYKINEDFKGYVDSLYLFLKKRGLKVFKSTDAFYTPKTCKDANIIIYIGHGGINKDSSTVGFYGMENNCVPDYIIKNLQVRKNSLVIYNHACTGAGTAASDTYDIGFDEAKRRVKINGDLYIKNSKTKCYFATNSVGGASEFLRLFLDKKMSVDQIYNKQFIDEDFESIKNIKRDKQYKITEEFMIKLLRLPTPWLEIKYDYSYAYYANPNYSVKDLLNY